MEKIIDNALGFQVEAKKAYAYDAHIDTIAIDELQAYREIGTVEEVQAMQAELAESGLNDAMVFQTMLELKQYADTGLSPEEVSELAQAKTENRLIVLPCAIGGIVYYDCYDYLNTRRIVVGFEVCWIRFDGVVEYSAFGDDEGWAAEEIDFTEHEIGKTVFLTRAEAEAALAERRGAE